MTKIGGFMATVSKGLLKNRMLEYFRTVERTGEELIVTDHRKPVLRVTPFKQRHSLRESFNAYQGKARFRKPVTEPETGEWGEHSL
jgi:antitoxin (DNA-binding transcriptional repressor) of toxin-antitoxin stability system